MSQLEEYGDHEDKAYLEAEAYQAPPPSSSSSSGKCLIYGCLFTMLFTLLLVIGGGFATFWFVKGQVQKYTSAEPADIPVVEYSEEEMTEVQNRVDSFREQIDAGETPEPLVLTAEEINALIAKDENLRGKVFVTIEDGLLSGDISVPTDALPGGKGRYFNASATFDVSLDNGVLIVTLDDAKVSDRPVPEQLLEGLRKENLAKDAYSDPEVAETLRRFDSIRIEGDTIILTPRLPQDAEKAALPAEAMPEAEEAMPEAETEQEPAEQAATDSSESS